MYPASSAVEILAGGASETIDGFVGSNTRGRSHAHVSSSSLEILRLSRRVPTPQLPLTQVVLRLILAPHLRSGPKCAPLELYVAHSPADSDLVTTAQSQSSSWTKMMEIQAKRQEERTHAKGSTSAPKIPHGIRRCGKRHNTCPRDAPSNSRERRDDATSTHHSRAHEPPSHAATFSDHEAAFSTRRFISPRPLPCLFVCASVDCDHLASENAAGCFKTPTTPRARRMAIRTLTTRVSNRRTCTRQTCVESGPPDSTVSRALVPIE